MLSMSVQSASTLNRLLRDLPEGLVVDATWLEGRGISSSLRAYYVKSGWLEQPVRGVYRRPRGNLSWEQVVISLQTVLLRNPLMVGGLTALELDGYAHYLSPAVRTVHLYGPEPPPSWLHKLELPQRFVFHSSSRLFRGEVVETRPRGVNVAASGHLASEEGLIRGAGFKALSLGLWNWPLTISRPERAILELLDELPSHESFRNVDMIMQGAASLSPKRLQPLLGCCSSVKVKRLFFFFADRYDHAWLKHLDKDAVDLGSGKRMLVPGGRLDRKYLITVPQELYDAP